MPRRTVFAVAIAFAVGSLPVAAMAQSPASKGKAPGPGQSEYAPGQKPGPAKKSAPGQVRKSKGDNPAKPGASEYAPGTQGKTGTGTATKKR